MANPVVAIRGGEWYFLRLMAEEIEKGYAPGSTFKPESRLYVHGKFRTALGPTFGPMFSDRFLKSRFKNLKKRHHEFSELLNQKGVRWDRKNNIVHGNEKLLRAYYKRSFRKRGCIGEVHYDLMCQIFESGVKFK